MKISDVEPAICLLLAEAKYPGNIALMELVRFFNVATIEQREK